MKRCSRLFSVLPWLFALLAVLWLTPALALTFPAGGTVNASSVNVRREPRSGAERVKKLSAGDQVSVTGEETDGAGNRWYAVTGDGFSGYILSEYLSVADAERIRQAEASGEAVMMRATVTAECADYHGLGKTWSRLHEINGLLLKEKGLTVTLAPDVPLTLRSSLKSKSAKAQATGALDSVYTPTAQEIAAGFTAVQTVSAVNKNGREAVWTVTFTFVPVGAVAFP